ncbi:5'-nucleotidase [Labilibaculum sp.]|uniref:5'-nucleotidase n=1 Tax=Labilibaculum sp. TaxID=2060723 RepID=UPI0035643020
MAYPIDKKLVVGIASSALFDLTESDNVFKSMGEEAYRQFQEDNIDKVLEKGVAFPFIRRLLGLNDAFPERQPIEVVLLSKNSPETGLRVFHSIQHYNLNITRAAFFNGKSPFEYIEAFNASLFLSASHEDVLQAIHVGFPAGQVLDTIIEDNSIDSELRLAFDFDGVIIDDEAEEIYEETKDLNKFHENETSKILKPHNPGPLSDLFQKISFFQKLERKKRKEDKNYVPLLKVSIVTARNAPSHERMINTLKDWEINVDNAFFLGGIDKGRILKVLRPHMFFDDQKTHLNQIDNIPMVHIPFGVANKV